MRMAVALWCGIWWVTGCAAHTEPQPPSTVPYTVPSPPVIPLIFGIPVTRDDYIADATGGFEGGIAKRGFAEEVCPALAALITPDPRRDLQMVMAAYSRPLPYAILVPVYVGMRKDEVPLMEYVFIDDLPSALRTGFRLGEAEEASPQLKRAICEEGELILVRGTMASMASGFPTDPETFWREGLTEPDTDF